LNPLPREASRSQTPIKAIIFTRVELGVDKRLKELEVFEFGVDRRLVVRFEHGCGMAKSEFAQLLV